MLFQGQQPRVESRGAALGLILLQGLGIGIASLVVGAGYGLWRHGPGLHNLLKGVDTVAMVVCLLSAWLMYGAYLTNKVEVGAYARLGQHENIRMTRMPIRTPVVVLLGGLLSQGVVLAFHVLK